MWVMTPYGFFSIVCSESDPEHKMMIRARDRKHLEALKNRFTGLPDIDEESGTDYPCRITAPRADVLWIVASMAESVDYTNFKTEAHRVSPRDKAFHNFLINVWNLGLRITKAAEIKSLWETRLPEGEE